MIPISLPLTRLTRPSLYLLLLLLPMLAHAQSAGDEDTAMLDGQMWALSTNGEDGSWDDADQYCQDLELAGHDDWRLPVLAELEDKFDPSRSGDIAIQSPLPQSTCCLWSSTTLEDIEPEDGHFYVGPKDDPADYAWGFLFQDEGIRYYSVKFMPDGQALCVRDP